MYIKSSIRCSVRIIRLIIHFIIGILISLLLRVIYGAQWYYNDIGSKTIQRWMQKASKIIGLKIIKSGELFQTKSVLYVANHVSWLDILAISSTVQTSFISKFELKKWPIIGFLANNTGTIFIKRANKSDINFVINNISDHLKKGKSVMLFPEGTTTNGALIKKFKSSLFQSAIDSNSKIQAIAIRYIRNKKLDTLAPYIDNHNFIIHIFRIMAQPETNVNLYINKEITTNNNNRQNLRFETHIQIKTSLDLIQE